VVQWSDFLATDPEFRVRFLALSGSYLERVTLRVVSRIEKLLERKCSGSGPEFRKYGRRDPSL
jgi:hypothetical protein